MPFINTILNVPRLFACVFFQFVTPSAPFVEHSLDGRVAIITGGNGGIGYETAKSLALQGCEVYILCRNPTKAETAVQSINELCLKRQSKGTCKSLTLDLADLESVKQCIEQLRELFGSKGQSEEQKKIDYFFCNGGVYQTYAKSPQGYEIHYATNHLGHFALVGGILDLLRRDQSRVVVLTGDIAVLQDDASPDYVFNDDGLSGYCRSKICNQAFGRLLHKQYPEISVFVVHPGVISSDLIKKPEESWGDVFFRTHIQINSEKGAQTSLLCALTNRYPRGSYVHNVLGACSYHPTAANQAWAENMWTTSVGLCKQHNVPLHF